jgi:hypothetical protein
MGTPPVNTALHLRTYMVLYHQPAAAAAARQRSSADRIGHFFQGVGLAQKCMPICLRLYSKSYSLRVHPTLPRSDLLLIL